MEGLKQTRGASGSTAAEEQTPGASGGALLAAAADAGHELQTQVAGVTHQVRQQATDQVSAQKERVVDTLDMVALLLRQSGEHAHLQDKAMLGGYLDKASDEVGKWSKMLDARDATQLIEETKRFAGRQPLLFAGGALAAGFLGTRFFRSSAQQLQPTDAAAGSTDGAPETGGPMPSAAPPAPADHAAENADASRAGRAPGGSPHKRGTAEGAAGALPGADKTMGALGDEAMSPERR